MGFKNLSSDFFGFFKRDDACNIIIILAYSDAFIFVSNRPEQLSADVNTFLNMLGGTEE